MEKILFGVVRALIVVSLIGASTFTIIQDVKAGTGNAPPFFTTGDITVSPTKVGIGESVTISMTVKNVGNTTGSWVVKLEIDGMIEETKEVELTAGTSKEIIFTTSKDVVGTYSVAINGVPADSFTVNGESGTALFPIIAGTIAVVIVLGLLAFFLVRRKAA